MDSFTQHLFQFFLSLGGFGLFFFSIIDAILFTPVANDVLLVALVSRTPAHTIYYVLIVSVGSTLGCLILDYFSRKGGEAGLKKTMRPKRFRAVKKRVAKSGAGWSLMLASTLPPPVPFTAAVATAAAFQYPRSKLLTIIGVSRLLRFSLLGYLAYRLGPRILELADQPAVRWSILGLIVVSFAGSAWVVFRKIHHV